MATLQEFAKQLADYGWVQTNEATQQTRVVVCEGRYGTGLGYSDLVQLQDQFGGRVEEPDSSLAEWTIEGAAAEAFLRTVRPWLTDDQGWLDEIAERIGPLAEH
jgi:hypothetical protein